MNKTILLLPCLLLSPCIAFACSTCMVGDPTQTLMGAEKPYENRVRFSTDFMSREESLGVAGVNGKHIREQRLSLKAAYAPDKRWMLSLDVPFVRRELQAFNLAQQQVSGLGDITFNFKNFLQQKTFMQKHLYGLLGGVKLASASEANDSNNVPLDFDVQPGHGATVVNFGAWYAHFNYPYMLYSSAAYHVASEGFQNFKAGDSVTLNISAQYSTKQLAYRLAIESRWSKADTFSGVTDPDSGGTIAYLAGGIIYTLTQDVLINLDIKIPAIDSLKGAHEESRIFTIGITYDFEAH